MLTTSISLFFVLLSAFGACLSLPQCLQNNTVAWSQASNLLASRIAVVPSPQGPTRAFTSTPDQPSILFNSSLSSSLNAVELNTVEEADLRTTIISCDGSKYGYNLNVASCMEAWTLLPKSFDLRSFGRRSQGRFDVPLPFRLLSCKHLVTACIRY